MRERERVRRYLALLLAFTMIFTSSSMNVLAATVVGGYKNSDKSQITTEESETSVETEIPEAAENDTEIRKNIVTFSTNGHAHVVVDGAAVDSTAYAKDGKIVFDVAVENGYQIESVLVDKSINARTTENGSYIIEGIQTDNTTVDITTVEVETEAQTEAVTETESETEVLAVAEPQNSVEPQAVNTNEEKIYTLTIEYFYKDGGRVENSYSGQFEDGTEFAVAVPVKEGYTITCDPVEYLIGNEIKGTIHSDLEITLTYNPQEVTYIVNHKFEQIDGSVKTDKETLTGLVGENTSAEVRVVEGYSAVAPVQQLLVNNNTVINIDYTLNTYKVTYQSNGGTYVAPTYAKYGEKISANGNPTRNGYTFNGWYMDAACTQRAGNNIEIKGDTTLFAKWIAKDVNYTVAYWYENADDSDYTYMYSEAKTAKADEIQTVKSVTAQDSKHFTFAKADTVTVKADGSTVLNVYFKRNTYTLTFKDNWKNVATITAKYRQYIADEFNKAPFNTTYNGRAWKATDRTAYSYALQTLDRMPDKNVTFNLYNKSSNTKKTIYYYVESVDGKGSENFGGKNYILLKQVDTYFNYMTYEEEYHEIAGYTRKSATEAGFIDSQKQFTKNQGKLYYTRNSYDLTFMNGGKVDSEKSFKYEASIKSGNYIPKRPTGLADYYEFAGWYYDETCTDPIDWETKTMPLGGLVVYAKWTAKNFTVTFDTQGGTAVKSQTVAGGNTVNTPVEPSRDGYEFVGWYISSDDNSQIFDLGMPITSDVTVYAKWKEIKIVNYTINYFKEGTKDALFPSQTYTGYVGTIVNAIAKSHTSYIADQVNKSIELGTKAENNVITFYYAEPHDVFYKVKYVNAVTGEAIYDSEVLSTRSNQVFVNSKVKDGFEVDAKRKSLVLNDEASESAIHKNIITFSYKPIIAVAVIGKSAQEEYNGQEKSVKGFDVSGIPAGSGISLKLKDGQKAEAVGTDVGTHNMGLKADMFETAYAGETYSADNCIVRINEITDGKLEITPAPATVTAANKSKMFGEADPELTADVSGLYGTDTVEYTLSREPGEDVGDYVITASGDADQGNYTVTYYPGTLTITKKGTLTVTGTPYEGIYDGNEHGSAASANITEGTTISYKVGEEDWTTTAPTIKDVGSKSVTVKAENPNYETAEATYTLTVNPKDVTVTADSKSKVYGDADPELTADVSGLLGEDQITYTLSRVAGEEEGTYAITPAGEEIQGNYKVTYNPGTLTITAQSIVPEDPSYRGIQIDDPRDYEYDAQEHKWEPTVTDKEGNELIEGTDYTVSYDTENFVDVKTITATITGMGNYSGTVIKTYQITPAPATVTAANKSKMFGEADPELTADVSGLYGTDTVEYTLSREPGEDVGDYVITASGEAAQGNYTVTYYPGTLTITKKGTLTVTGTPYEGIYDGNEHGSAASANVTEGTTISYKVGEEDWTTTAPTIKDVGSKSVTVKAENPNYETAEAVYTLTVNPKDVTVTADSKSKVYGDADPELTADVSGLLGEDQVTYTLSRAAGEEEGTYAITPAGEEIQGNYKVTYHPGTLTITAQSIVPEDPSYRGIQIDDPRDYEYDAQEHKWEPTVTDKEENELIKETDYTVSYDTDNFVDVKTITVTITGKGSYTGTVTRVYSITPAPVKITTDSDSKVYDGTPLTAGGTVTGLVNGETVSFVTTGSQTEVGFSDNTYTLAWDQTAKKGNYNVVKEEIGTLTVTENTNEIVVTTTGGTFVYDGQPHGAKVSVSALPEGYTLKAAASSASATDVTETDVKATADTLVIVNKDGVDVTNKLNIKRHDGTIKVTPAAVTIITQGATKVYDGTPLTAGGTMTGLVNGETAGFETTGSQTDVGSRYNNYSTIWSVPPYTAKRSNYTVEDTMGILRVTAQSIVPDPENPESYLGIKISNPQNHVYDGQEHKWTPTVTDKDGKILKEGTDYTVSYNEPAEETEAFKDVQTITVTIEGTGNYTGTATRVYHITPAPVTITTDSDSKVYDGTPLTAGGTVTGLAEGETVGFKTTGSQTEVGFSDNTYEIVWAGEEVQDSDKELVPYTAKRSNYMIENILGRLTVTAQSIEPEDPSYRGIQIDDPSDHEYDAQEHKWEPMVTDKDGNKLTKGTDYTVSYDTDNFVDVKTITVTITGMGNYSGTVIKTYQITPKEVTIRTYTDSKVYDGNALTADGEINGLVEGETVGFETTGSQTYVGSSDNTYEITWAQEEVEVQASDKESTPYTAKKSNYTVSETIGTLTVTDGTEKEPVEPSLVVKKNDEQADGYQYKLGETVSFTISVTNIYDEAKDVTITELAGVIIEGADAGTPNVLVKSNVAPGETVTATATYTITEEDVANGFFRNTVKAAFNGGKTFENEKTVDTEEADRSYSLNKISSESAHESGMFKAGETIHYTITAVNTGNQTIKNLQIEDTLKAAGTISNITAEGVTYTQNGNTTVFTIAELPAKAYNAEKAAPVVIEYDYLVQEADKGNVISNAIIGRDPEDPEKPGEGGGTENTVEDPKLEVTKDVVSIAAEDGTAKEVTGKASLNDVITYQVTVKNTGNIRLMNVKLADSLEDIVLAENDSFDLGTLDVGEEKKVTYTYTVKEADLGSTIVNVATATGDVPEDPEDTPKPSGEDKKEVPTDEKSAAIQVTKTVTSKGSTITVDGKETTGYRVGDTIEFNIHVENTGNITVNNIVVNDVPTLSAGSPKGSITIAAAENGEYTVDGSTAAIAALAPRASVDIKASYLVIAGDGTENGNELFNTAFAAGTSEDPDNPQPEDSSKTDPVPIEPESDGHGEMQGTITVTKMITTSANKTPENGVDAVIKVGLYDNASFSGTPVAVNTITISKGTSGTTVFDELDNTSGTIYYVAELDDNNNPIIGTSSHLKGYGAPHYSENCKNGINPTEEDNADATIVNPLAEDDQEETEITTETTGKSTTSTKSSTAAKTGDNTNMMVYWILLGMAALAGCTAVVYRKKKRNQ